jgi:primosomal replication protein N
LRFTPAGMAAVDFRLEHESEIEEAGKTRTVRAEIPAVAFQTLARLVAGAKLGAQARFEGFLGAKTRRSKRLVLHVTDIEFLEGARDASTP